MTDTTTNVAENRGVLRGLYNWTMRHSKGPHAHWYLAGVAFSESSWFPLPPDIMLVPMALADRSRAFWLAGWCTLWSVLGGLLGYAIGALLYDSVGHWLINVYGMASDIDTFRALYVKYGAWIILLKGLTPIPYKIVTIASGFAGYSLPLFIVLSIVTRGLRFLIVGALLYWFGEPVRYFIEKRLEWVMLGLVAIVIGGFVLARYAF